mgnify:CR=1 FL=1
MNQDDRIDQFRKMAKANPDDDLAHYALGQALLDADRHAEAVNVLRHVLKLNDGYSRAYVLLGQAQHATGDEEGAIETWQRGYGAAMNRGDLMPANELKGLLKGAGSAPSTDVFIGVDEPAHADDGREPGEGEVRCVRSRRIGQRMSFQPFEDEAGAYIVEHICQESWEAWMEMSIKVINELRLDLGDAAGQRAYDEHMRDFLNLPGTLFEGRDYGD